MTMEVIPEPWHKLGASWNISEEIEIRKRLCWWHLTIQAHLLSGDKLGGEECGM